MNNYILVNVYRNSTIGFEDLGETTIDRQVLFLKIFSRQNKNVLNSGNFF